MKMIYVSPRATAPWLTMKYAAALAEDGAEIKIFATDKSIEPYKRGIVKASLPVVAFRDVLDFPLIWRLPRYLEPLRQRFPSPSLLWSLIKERADLYIASHPDDLWFVALAARRTGGQCAYLPFEFYPGISYGTDKMRARYSRQERRYAKEVCCWISPGDMLSDQVRSLYDIGKTVHTIYSSVPLDLAFKPMNLRERLGLDSDALILLYTGGISKARGLWEVVEALSDVPDNVYFVVIGGDEDGVLSSEALELQRFAVSLGVDDRIRVHPKVPQDELLSFTMEADIGIIPIRDVSASYRYCNPGKLFEFLAAGLPLVVRDCLAQISWYVSTHGLGEIFESDSRKSLANAISLLARNPDYRRRCAQKARHIHATEACWERQAVKLREAVLGSLPP